MVDFLCSQALLPSGWAKEVRIRVDETGFIRGVEPGGAPAGGGGEGLRRLGPTVPGMANVHSHAFQRAMAGLAERRGADADSFWSWRDVMYRFTHRLSPEDVDAVSALAQCEMLEAGFTAVGEFHYLHHDRDGRAYDDPARMAAAVTSAAERTGIALTLLPVFYRHGGFGGAPATGGQRRFLNDPDRFARLLESTRPHVDRLAHGILGLAPHSLRAATLEEIEALLPLAGDAPVHIHLAEQRQEVDACLAHHGARPVELVLDRLPVDGRWCLIHCTHARDAEVAGLARSGAVVGLCPVTEANLGDGVFPAADLLARGGRLAVGTDSNVRIDLADELRTLEYGQRLTREERNVLAAPGESTGGRLFREASAAGARALGQPMGRLAVGSRADLVALDPSHPNLQGRSGDALLDAWIFTGDTRMVREVWVGGRAVVEEGRAVAREEAEAAFRRARARLEAGS